MDQIEKLMSMVVKPFGCSPVYNCLLGLNNERNGINFSRAIGLTGENGKLVSTDYCFRIGSITKLFTSTIILQLKEEGLLRLEDFYFDLVGTDTLKKLSGLHSFNGTDYFEKISIFHLLQHQSGLRDYFSADERFLKYVMEHPSQLWNWELVMEKYFEFELNLKTTFAPGNEFHYSDTNYLLLAILIEQITNKPLYQVYREKISTPLELNDTYLEFHEIPREIKPMIYPYYGTHSLENINTSFDWGGGGLISTMTDLTIFIRSLIKGHLFKNVNILDLTIQPPCSLPLAQNKNKTNQYRMGIQQKNFSEYAFVGHDSAYGSMLFYEPVKDISIILSLNQATAVQKAGWLMKKIILEFQKGITEE